MHKVLILAMLALPALAAAQGQPCSTPAFRAFDYWIGEWEVRDTAGTVIGHQSITRIGNCGIAEHWQPRGGAGEGRSISWYSPADSSWNQLYLGAGGWRPVYRGTVNAEGEIEMWESADAVPTGRAITKMRYYKKPGGLQQVLWSSTDRGQTWTVGFVGNYTPRP